MRADEQLKELCIWNLEQMAQEYKQKLTITCKGIWVTVQFGTLVTIKSRGYRQVVSDLDDWIEKNLLHHEPVRSE